MNHTFYKTTLFSLCLFYYCSLAAQPIGYQYVRELVIQESQIPDGAALTDFPVLVQLSDANLRSTANGGHIASNNGYDILFYLNGCATKLDHQLDYYDPVTGDVTAWVRIPSLSTTVNTNIYLYYGNAAVTSSTSVATVWDAAYSGVWHLTEDPGGAAPQMTDGTSHARHGTSNGSMSSANSVIGKMGRALSFDETNDYIRIPDFLYGQELTVSFWFNLAEVTGNSYQYFFSHGPWSTQNSLNVYIGEDNITIPAEIPNRNMLKTNFRDNNDANNFDILDAGNTFVDGNWHYYCIRIQDFGGATVYIDGAPVVNYAVWGANSFDPVTDIFLGGREDLHAQRHFGGLLDETRISSAWRSSNWISTEYNNQQAPGSFVVAGAEVAALTFCGVLPLRLTDFQATRQVNGSVQLSWRAEDPSGPVRYTIQRSPDASRWEPIQSLDNISRYTDSFPPKGPLYYRLRYEENGKTSLSAIRSVAAGSTATIRLYPNPTTGDRILAALNGTELPLRTELYDAAGRSMGCLKMERRSGQQLDYDLPAGLPKGLYVLRMVFPGKNEQHSFLIR